MAKKTWEELQRFNPKIYLDNFSLSSDKTLFSSALSRYKIFSEEKYKFNEMELAKFKTSAEKLIYILEKSNTYINKEELIYLIWNESWTPKNDSRLISLIHLVKKRDGFKITRKDGSYKLVA